VLQAFKDAMKDILRGHLLTCKRQPMSGQYATFYKAKGGILHLKR